MLRAGASWSVAFASAVGAARTGRRTIVELMALEIIKVVGRKFGGAV